MRAIVLAAGRGERMRPLTDTTPKPLLRVAGHALIEYHLRALALAGVRTAVVNVSWQSRALREYLGDGSRFGLELGICDEGPVALETGGGIHNALGLLGPGPFLVVNGDIWTDYPLAGLRLPPDSLARLVLVPNPPHHPRGDFALAPDGRLREDGPRRTYAGIAIMHPDLFEGSSAGRFPLKPLLDRALRAGRLSGESWDGAWFDVGTPERLAELDRLLREGRLKHPLLAGNSR